MSNYRLLVDDWNYPVDILITARSRYDHTRYEGEVKPKIPDDAEHQFVYLLLLGGVEGYKLGNADDVEWVDSRDEKPLSFEWCCDAFGIDTDAARQALRRQRNGNA